MLFLDDGGKIVARLPGRPGLRDELLQRLTELLLLPQAEGMYGWTCRIQHHWSSLLKAHPPMSVRIEPRIERP